MKNIAYLSLGSNLGNKIQNISQAINEIASSIGEVLKKSSNYISEPWGFESTENFINAVISIQTNYSPTELIDKIKVIEKKMGRIRLQNGGYSNRIIDIDILYFNEEILDSVELTIPHPNLYDRKFVLVPFNEISPNFIDPLKKTTINELINNCSDESTLKKVINNNAL